VIGHAEYESSSMHSVDACMLVLQTVREATVTARLLHFNDPLGIWVDTAE